jgi:hypothetical protein
MAPVVRPGKAMRLKKAIVPAADLPRCARAYAAAPSLRAWLCGVLVLVALSACGSVQTTTSGDPSSIPQSVSDPQRPVITGNPPTSAQVGVVYDYTPNVSDTVSTALTFSITNMPAWATFNTATGELKGTPSAEDVGTTNEIEISVSDSVGEATVGPFRITVTAAQTPPPATAPTITGTPSASVVAGQAYSFTPTASDLMGKLQHEHGAAHGNTHGGQRRQLCKHSHQRQRRNADSLVTRVHHHSHAALQRRTAHHQR